MFLFSNLYRFFVCFFSALCLANIFILASAWSQSAFDAEKVVSKDNPVDFEADSLTHDEEAQIITASGNVELVQAGRILKADQVSYDLANDTVRARGNVVLTDTNGDVYFADDVELTDSMREGFVLGLRGLLQDGSRFEANEGRRVAGNITTMRNAKYTACEVCEEEPLKPPVWQIKASEVTHNKEESRISYKNATFEIFGIPLAYAPYFSHPDGSIKQKSGFLSPAVGFDSELGGFYEQGYYWAINPSQDLTLSVIGYTDENPLAKAEYRQRFANAYLELEGGLTSSERKDTVDDQVITRDEEVRGHLFGEALWNINNKWRAGMNLELTSDDQYARQYDLSSKDVLENEVYLERFSGRNYASARIIDFQDIRVNPRETDQPNVLPEIEAEFLGEPNALLGGRWSLGASALGLQRDDDGQDLTRGSVKAGWERRSYTDFGLVTTLSAHTRGDGYFISDRDVAEAGSGRSTESSEARGFAQAHMEVGYPLAKAYETLQALIEPQISLTAGTNIDVNDDVPNEDSQDVQVDSNNIFEPNRFPGYDRIEDRSHITYGLRTGLYGYKGAYGEVFLGQSHRFDSDDNPFPEGSGLSENDSDIVGQIEAGHGKSNINYRFQLDNNNYSSIRHEVRGESEIGKVGMNARYFFAKDLEGTDITQSREQLRLGSFYRISDEWRLSGTARYDLGEDSGLRRASVGLDYYGQCISLSARGTRNLTREESGDSGTEIIFRLGLRNLGEFVTSGLSVGDSSN